MKIAMTTKGQDWDSAIDPRFGRTDYILIFDEDSEALDAVDNTEIEGVAHGAGPQTSRKLMETGAEVLITGNGPGGNASAILEKTGIAIYTGAGDMTAAEAYKAYKDGKLTKI